MKKPKVKKAERYGVAVDQDSIFPSTNKWYILDFLTHRAADTQLFRSSKRAEAAANKLNAKEGGFFVRLTNGYVALAQGEHLGVPILGKAVDEAINRATQKANSFLSVSGTAAISRQRRRTRRKKK